MNEKDEYQRFKSWIREQSESIVLLKMEGYLEDQAIEMLKLFEMERISKNLYEIACRSRAISYALADVEKYEEKNRPLHSGTE